MKITEDETTLLDPLWCKLLWGFYPPGYEDLEKDKNMKEVYTDLEKKPGTSETTFKIILDKDWMSKFNELDVELIYGEDIVFDGKPKKQKDTVIYTFKAISDKAKKLFIAE